MDKRSKSNESVWDYPRPPKVERSQRRIRVVFSGEMIAETQRACRVLETSHPPVYYIPPEDVRMEYLHRSPHRSFCEFKGMADYWDIEVNGRAAKDAGWSYPSPNRGYETIRDFIAFYPSRVDACYVDEERVQPQPGDFYGGWITSEIEGPFKGDPGTEGW